MKTNVQIEISVQEILCWIGLVLIAWNPTGAFSGMIEAVGYKAPLTLLASGAGAPGIRTVMNKLTSGGNKQ